jgi:predicted nucleic acid-binding protein
MNTTFADSAFYLALASESDELHELAVAWSRAPGSPVITTAWVLTEVADALAAPRQRPVFLGLLSKLEVDPTP